ncbi:MAG: hypothetical protein C4324_10495 [Blastocatellia bacterium]
MCQAPQAIFLTLIFTLGFFNSVNRRGKYVFSTSGFLLSSPIALFLNTRRNIFANRRRLQARAAVNTWLEMDLYEFFGFDYSALSGIIAAEFTRLRKSYERRFFLR